MAKTFVDRDFLQWEAYPSGGAFGFPENPYVVFTCLTNRRLRARSIAVEGDEADAERMVSTASRGELLDMFERSKDIR